MVVACIRFRIHVHVDSTNLSTKVKCKVLRYSLDIPVSLPTVSPSYVPRQLSRDDYLIDYLMIDLPHMRFLNCYYTGSVIKDVRTTSLVPFSLLFRHLPFHRFLDVH